MDGAEGAEGGMTEVGMSEDEVSSLGDNAFKTVQDEEQLDEED